MAISASTVWEIRTTGSDTNGGGYSSGGTDYSQQDAAQLALTDVVANGTTTLTSVTGGFTAAMIGNTMYLQGGTGPLTATRRQITAVGSTNSITVDATVTAGTGITGNVGGALASIGECAGFGYATSNDIYIKAGTYTMTTTSANVSGGRVSGVIQGSTSANARIFGYNTTRGDIQSDRTLTRPVISAGAQTAFTMVICGNYTHWDGITFDGNSGATVRGLIPSGSNGHVSNCRFLNFTNNATSTADWEFHDCEFTGCTTQPVCLVIESIFTDCTFHGNTVVSLQSAGAGTGKPVLVNCLFFDNTGATTDGIGGTIQWGGMFVRGCTFDAMGRDAIRVSNSAENVYIENCIITNSGAYGIKQVSGATIASSYIRGCSFYGNTTADYIAAEFPNVYDCQVLSADPYTSAATDDYSIAATEPKSAGVINGKFKGSETQGNPTPGANPKGGGGDSPGTPPAGGGGGILGGGAW